ncbi:MAG: hypothetical protein OQJ84_09490 [Xanthomonadales bacterium]|nr:hypothetical protein [Xanthomonadales bacterium]
MTNKVDYRRWPSIIIPIILVLVLQTSLWAAPLEPGTPVRGWTLLSDNEPLAMKAIAAAHGYDINHLQLSHKIVHDLNEIDDPARRGLVNRLLDAAHEAGIGEVVLWDHALYALDYYPQRFRTGPHGTIDLDDPEFWEWLKADYRRLLDLVPQADGLVLTFIETGARVEQQQSEALKTEAARLAAVVNAVADVVIGERGLALYARTFSYTRTEFANVLEAVRLIERPEVRLMMKETPHDFFIPHPPNPFIGAIERSTLVEFDAAGEYFGQSVIVSTMPDLVLGRWRAVGARPNVIGYVARTDRFGNTQIVGRAAEINLRALEMGVRDPQVTEEQVYDEFITNRYGKAAVPDVKAALRRARDIVSASLYTLGTDIGHRHSRLNYDTHTSSYVRHVPGKWIEPPVVYIEHGINREFHYWRDVVDHLAPAYVKNLQGSLWDEVPEVRTSGWIQPGERMTEEYLRLILKEKDYGLSQARAALADIERSKPVLRPEDYRELQGLFERTVLTARIHRAVAAAYFGFRVWCRGPDYRNAFVTNTVREGLDEIRAVAPLISGYPGQVPLGQWNWRQDADRAERYFQAIAVDGWPASTNGVPNPEGGMVFPYRVD